MFLRKYRWNNLVGVLRRSASNQSKRKLLQNVDELKGKKSSEIPK